MTKRTYGPYSVDHFLHSISWKWLTTEVLFHLPFKSVTHSSKGAVPTFARDSLWPRTHVSDMCARIRVFLNPPLFLSGFKNFHVHTYPYSNGICPSTRIRRKLAHRIPNAPTITKKCYWLRETSPFRVESKRARERRSREGRRNDKLSLSFPATCSRDSFRCPSPVTSLGELARRMSRFSLFWEMVASTS